MGYTRSREEHAIVGRQPPDRSVAGPDIHQRDGRLPHQLELIQPVHGPTTYEDHLSRKGEGLHHIKEYIPDEQTEATLAFYRAKGIAVTQTGKFDADYHYYMDTEPKLDFVLELGNCPVLDLPPEVFTMFPSEDA